MTAFTRHAVLLFCALRVGDLVNLAAGMWLVPKFVSPNELGAVLPVTSFATLLAIPAFAFALVFMREAAALAAHRQYGRLKTLVRGVFLGSGMLLMLTLAIAAALVPRFLERMRVPDAAAGFFVIAAAFLGCLAPVYTDALNALKRFRSLGAIEIFASCTRFIVMAATMPFKAFAGYFAGNAAQPIVRILGSAVAMRRELSVAAEPFWDRASISRLSKLFAAVSIYQIVPMAANFVEQTVLRIHLGDADSAGYYLASRFSDILGTVTFPLLTVLFPHAADITEKGGSIRPVVLRCAAFTLAAATVLSLIYAAFAEELMALLPNGEKYLAYAAYLPWLIAINAITACQYFCTNAEIAAGRFGFLIWFAPMNIIYPAALWLTAQNERAFTFETLLWWFTAASLLRFAGAAATLARPAASTRR